MQFIHCTKHHNGTSNDEWFLIDFDLAILGQSKTEYTGYTLKIRKEYAQVPNFMYRKGRRKVLQHFLNKTSIYQTKEFKLSFEKQARANLSDELRLLSA